MDVRITGAEQLSRLSQRLKDAGRKDLNKELNKAIRTAAKPAVADTKRAINTLPVRGARGGGGRQRERHHYDRSRAKDEDKRKLRAQRSSGLRATVASAVRLKIRTGRTSRGTRVRIEVDSGRLPADQRNLPRHLDNPKGWRHPVFGNDEVWVAQFGRPWFASTIRRHLPTVRAAVQTALNTIATKIEKGS
ncbi:hypothetical protein ACFWYW_14615 [Nonomuraea sp. NPDC059023]|uniref:hypothetical protein n=1 Tax=unclassified Nonomuraea TaxID=2593643 RepID=UPI0036C96C98